MHSNMSDQNSSPNISASSETAIVPTTAQSHTNHLKRRIAQNFLLIWMDANVDHSKEYCQKNLTQLRDIISDVDIFTQCDECIDFLTDVDHVKVFLIIEGILGQQIVPLIHDIPQLGTIYVFCNNKLDHEQWTKEWVKIKGIHTDIVSICEILRQDVKQCNKNSIAVSFVPLNEETSNDNLDRLDPSFMYTQIFKKILLDMKHDEQSVKNFIAYCRNSNCGSPNNIDRFENEYHAKLAIWWYTFPSFIYSMLNGALRMLEGDIIIKMGFFIHDLHDQIEQLHQQQISSYHGQPFTVYRGQGLSITDFEKLLKTKGGLMSFNNFLSTSTDKESSLVFAHSALAATDTVGILFKMTVNPIVSSAPFACVQNDSYFQTEEEILFSMHTVFRIGEINKIDNNNSLYQVEIKLTADDDQQLHTLTERIQKELKSGPEWNQLGALLIKIGQFDEAEEAYKVLLEQTFDECEKTPCYNQLGYIKIYQGDSENAIWYYKKGLEISEKAASPDHFHLFAFYNNIASAYTNMKDNSKALLYYEKALNIQQNKLDQNNPDLAALYNNISLVHTDMKQYSKALSFSEKALEVRQKTLLLNDPSLAISYSNIGELYQSMGQYSKALSMMEKALEIQHKTLPANHLHLATSYNNIGFLHYQVQAYSKACYYYDKALEIYQKILSSNHPYWIIFYRNIALTYMDMGHHSKALSFHKKSLEISEKHLPPDHIDLAASYTWIGFLYIEMKEYSQALLFHTKAIQIWQKLVPLNYDILSTVYHNMGGAYQNVGDNSKALLFFEKALEIWQKTLPSNHTNLAASYNNIGFLHNIMQEYSKSLSFYTKALQIWQKTLLPNHSNLASCYNNIASVYVNIRDYSKALSYLEQTLDIWQILLPPNDPDVKIVQGNIELVKKLL